VTSIASLGLQLGVRAGLRQDHARALHKPHHSLPYGLGQGRPHLDEVGQLGVRRGAGDAAAGARFGARRKRRCCKPFGSGTCGGPPTDRQSVGQGVESPILHQAKRPILRSMGVRFGLLLFWGASATHGSGGVPPASARPGKASEWFFCLPGKHPDGTQGNASVTGGGSVWRMFVVRASARLLGLRRPKGRTTN